MAKKDIIVLLAFLALVLLFFGRFLTGSQIIAFKDLSRYFYPLRYLMVEQVMGGQLPLWNPYIFCGFPLLATLQIGFFYPLSLIHYLLPFGLAFNYYIILHYFLAAGFMFFLLRHFRLGRSASFLGGVVFAFSGYLLSVSNMNTSLSSVIWLPLILLCFDRLLVNKSFLNIVGLALLLAIQFLGGEPTVIYVTILFLLGYAAVFSRSFKGFLGNTGGLLLAGSIALGLVAVQLLPFIELAGLSNRVVRTAYDVVTVRSFPPRELLTFIFPYFFGAQVHFGNYSEALLGQINQDWLVSPYLGIIPLFFVFLSLRQKTRLTYFFAGTVLFSLLLAFGKYTPLYRLAYLVPGVSMIRYPVKYLFLTTFALSVLAALGFDGLLRLFDRAGDELKKVLGAVQVVFVFCLGLFVAGYFLRLQIFYFLIEKYFPGLHALLFDFLADILRFNLISLLNMVFYLFALLLLLLEASRGKVKQFTFAALLIALVTLDILANGYPIMMSVDAANFSELTENQRIMAADQGLYRFFYTPAVDVQNRVVLGDDFSEALFEVKDDFAANWHIPHHFYDFFGYASIHPRELLDYYKGIKNDQVEKRLDQLSAFNVKYVASDRQLKAPGLKLLRHKQAFGKQVYLYENENVLPRAYLLDGQGRPVLKNAKVEILEYRAGRVLIQAEAQQRGLLFLSDAFYPGWRAYVDKKEVRIVRAKEFFRAVP
ncbi:YfhO family protein, partial [Candidatus Margulisiibacteriota bacterium]